MERLLLGEQVRCFSKFGFCVLNALLKRLRLSLQFSQFALSILSVFFQRFCAGLKLGVFGNLQGQFFAVVLSRFF